MLNYRIQASNHAKWSSMHYVPSSSILPHPDVGTVEGFYQRTWTDELVTSKCVHYTITNILHQPYVLVCSLTAAGFEQTCCTSCVFVQAQVPPASTAGAQVGGDDYKCSEDYVSSLRSCAYLVCAPFPPLALNWWNRVETKHAQTHQPSKHTPHDSSGACIVV